MKPLFNDQYKYTSSIVLKIFQHDFVLQKSYIFFSFQLTSSTSGFVITEDKESPLNVASVVLNAQDKIETKLNQLKDIGFNPQNSWGVALSSSLRGYEGDDITPQHIEAKNVIQKKECKLFHEISGNNYIGAQVEDVFGTNHVQNLYKTTPFDFSLSDRLGLFTPEVHADDSSTVFLVVKQSKKCKK